MSSRSKRLRNISPESATDTTADDTKNFDVAATLQSRSATSEDDDTGSSVFTCGVNKLLPVILDNLGILTPQDLLHCRLVSRCWLDAATSVLLKRRSCEIVLKIGEVALGGDADPNSYEQLLVVKPNCDRVRDRDDIRSPIFKYYNARPPHSLLPDLIQTISKSREFPSNSLKFLPGCEKALRNIHLPRLKEMYQHADDELVRLFSLWGKNVKKLTIYDQISSNSVEKLLFMLLPNLCCLDFSKCYKFKTQDQDTKHNQVFHLGNLRSRKFNPELRLGKLEKIIPGVESNLHWSKKEFFKLLVHISPNLHVVQDAGIAALTLLINMKKAHLIKSLFYIPVSRHQHECGNLKEALEVYPDSNPSLTLRQLTIRLSGMSGKRAAYGKLTTVLNLILRDSKDTLEYLEFHVNPQDFLVNIKIPPLRKLKCLKLVRENEPFQNPLYSRQSGSESGKLDRKENLALDQVVYGRNVFQFQDRHNLNKIPQDYFPVLSKVELEDDVDSGSLNTANKLLAFFALEHTRPGDESIVSGDVIRRVSSLGLSAFPKVDNKLGRLFPNLRNLKIKCESASRLYNWVWRAFPKLERFQIYDFIPGSMDKDAVDSFFTGIPQEFCTKVAANIESIPRPEFTSEQNLFYRTQPYIVDCRNLKEFTIHFKGKICGTFATKLSSLFAFQGIIDKTKIVFSFASVDLSENEVEEMEKHLKPVCPYIEIRL